MTVLFLFAVPLGSEKASEGASVYHVDGYVVTHALTGNVPLPGVTVEILYGSTVASAVSDENGYFNVTVGENTNLRIRFILAGYSLISCPHVSKQIGMEYYALDISQAHFDGVNKYTVTSDSKGFQCAVMGVTNATLTGTVTYDSGPVVGATVTLSANRSVLNYETVTDSKGMYSINCMVGDYQLTVTCNGFKSSAAATVNVSDNTPPVSTVLTKNDIKMYFGLDMVHMLMIMGVIFAMTITIFVLVVSRRPEVSMVSAEIGDDEED